MNENIKSNVNGHKTNKISNCTAFKVVEEADKKRESLLEIFKEHLNNKYNTYFFWFFICEQLNFGVVILQWFITNNFLKFQFIR